MARLQFLFYRLFAMIFRERQVDHAGRSFRLTTSTANEVHRAFTFSAKEPETIAWIDSFTEPAVFYDVGANVGVYTLYACARHPALTVYAFEPEGQSFAGLCRNIVRNGFAMAHPYCCAVSNATGPGELSVSSLAAGAGAAALGSDYKFLNKAPVFRQGIFAVSIDDLILRFALPFPNYLKVDVDGLETEILEGSGAALRDPRLRGLLVEFQYSDESDLTPMLQRLSSLGLELHGRSEWIAHFEGLQSRNFIFRRRT